MRIPFSTILALFLLFTSDLFAQSGSWDVYMAKWDGTPGSVMLNMELIHRAPLADLPFLIITGVTVKNCRPDGLPVKENMEELYQVSDSLVKVLGRQTITEHAGTFTHACKRLEYVYVKDTGGLRHKLYMLYESQFKDYAYSISVSADARWTAYREFLYPNEETRVSMDNLKKIALLSEKGDKSTMERTIDFWLSFKTAQERMAFMQQIKSDGFNIRENTATRTGKFNYQLHISKTGRTDYKTIQDLTLELKKKAKQYGGDYDSWEAEVVN